ncbi:right-handed parallel beta-helix repeat-containing protein [Tenggerimyces flavus]|uniref:Right-handed parallel beta-helix repeat-containing protein n=1 Tax=Tenggerimyces flavus TaxID=1708749 RepID=A0ABV7YCQ5_9ACTN|nr:right-handed parallel beta-helix repeat-containing protein [Tenggerimyces flavus]MBM7787088.1 hypothetical protein [Tenggerimyces flavus]
MTRRDWTIAGISAAVVAVLALVIAAMVWPDSPDPRAAGSTTSTVPESPLPNPLLTTSADPEPEVTDPAAKPDDEKKEEEKEEDEKDKEKKRPEDAALLADAPAAGEGQLPDSQPVTCPQATVEVSDANGLAKALEEAQPGAVIGLADGTYGGKFVTSASGTPEQPIYLCGGAGAVLDGENIKGGYVFHLNQAKHWRLVGFTVTNGQKGVMADGTVGSVIQGLTVHTIGDEAIHLRNFSTDNVVLQNKISKTGLRRDKFGEGVYIGTAVSNWCTNTDCKPDRSDRNVVKGNDIREVSSEAIDIKEATTGGLVEGNTFDGKSITGADSWLDMKGNNWLVRGNTGTNSPLDGFQTHQILKGWGDHNVFTQNVATVNGPGHGFALRPAESNVVKCDNQVSNAAEGVSNEPCQ